MRDYIGEFLAQTKQQRDADYQLSTERKPLSEEHLDQILTDIFKLNPIIVKQIVDNFH